MWPFKKKVKQRRMEVRKAIRQSGPRWWRSFREAGGLGSLLLVGAFYAAVLAMDAWPADPLPYRIGQYVPHDIHARVAFKDPSEKLRTELVSSIKDSTPATFALNEKLVEEILATLSAAPERLKSATRPADVTDDLLKELAGDTAALAAWRARAEGGQASEYAAALEKFREDLYQTPIVRPAEVETQSRRKASQVWIVYPGGRKLRGVSNLITLRDTNELKFNVDGLTVRFDPALRRHIGNYLMGLLTRGRVLYVYDAQATEKDISAAIAALTADQWSVAYEAGDRIVPSTAHKRAATGDASGLSGDRLELLRKEHAAYMAALRARRPWAMPLRFAGRAAVLALLTVLLATYIAHYQPRIVRNHWRGFAVGTVLLLMLLVAKISVAGTSWDPHIAVLGVLLAAIIFTIAYEQRFALAVGLVLSALVVIELRESFSMFVVLMAGVMAAVFPLRDVRTRSKLIEVSALAAAVVFLAIWATSLADGIPWRFALAGSLWGAGFALLAGFVTQGVLPLVERTFDIATSMTLLEWCDASKPLLRRLAMEAPGTYNHSLQLGSMCEAAAEAIGARGLLARVGAYYHDIGKINKPDYFIENEAGSSSRHAKLSPAMSLLIIIGHVKDGLEMAREYGLPKVLHQFIAGHHGTTLVQYFYHAAAEQRKSDKERAPDEVEFRYPGPKPRSREVAILMLADAAESSVRAMGEPTPGRIENQVHTMVSRRLMDGQLDECDLTLKEVHQIEVSLVKSLCAMYHGRITYPTPAGQKPSAGELERERRKVEPQTEAPAEAPAQEPAPPSGGDR